MQSQMKVTELLKKKNKQKTKKAPRNSKYILYLFSLPFFSPFSFEKFYHFNEVVGIDFLVFKIFANNRFSITPFTKHQDPKIMLFKMSLFFINIRLLLTIAVPHPLITDDRILSNLAPFSETLWLLLNPLIFLMSPLTPATHDRHCHVCNCSQLFIFRSYIIAESLC